MSSKKVSTVQSKQRNSNSNSMSNTSIDCRKSRTLPQFSNHSNNNSFEGYDDEEDNEGLSHDRVKTMFMSIWNNVKFGQFSIRF